MTISLLCDRERFNDSHENFQQPYYQQRGAVATTAAVGRLVVVRGLSKKPKQMLLLASQAHAVL